MSDRFEIFRPSSMRLSGRLVCSSGLTSSQYFNRITPEWAMAFSTSGVISRKCLCLTSSSVQIPITRSTPARLQMRGIALGIRLRFLALGRREKCNDPKDARAHSFCDSLDCAALACSVEAFKDNANLQAFVHDPLL
jgi:hypothetical protein